MKFIALDGEVFTDLEEAAEITGRAIGSLRVYRSRYGIGICTHHNIYFSEKDIKFILSLGKPGRPGAQK